jgi:hypothetical protein
MEEMTLAWIDLIIIFVLQFQNQLEMDCHDQFSISLVGITLLVPVGRRNDQRWI